MEDEWVVTNKQVFRDELEDVEADRAKPDADESMGQKRGPIAKRRPRRHRSSSSSQGRRLRARRHVDPDPIDAKRQEDVRRYIDEDAKRLGGTMCERGQIENRT